MRKMLFLKSLLVVPLLVLALFGCSTPNTGTLSSERSVYERPDQPYTGEASSDEGPASDKMTVDEPSPEETEGDTFTIDEVVDGAASGTYIQRESRCYELYEQPYGNVVFTRDDRLWCVTDDVCFSTLEAGKGDQLITTIAANEATCFPVIGSCFIGGNREFIDGYLLDYKRNEGTEINGTPLTNVGESSLELTRDQFLSAIHDEVQEILLPSGIEVLDLDHGMRDERYAIPTNNMFASEQPASFTCGTYIGTDWTEEVVSIDIPCYIVQNKGFTDEFPGKAEIDLPVEKTKSGYFVIDYSELEPGRYECQVGGTKCLIEVA